MLSAIRISVANNKLKDALQSLHSFANMKNDKVGLNKALVIEYQYNTLEQNYRRGKISEADKKTEMLEIVMKILNLADEIDAKN